MKASLSICSEVTGASDAGLTQYLLHTCSIPAAGAGAMAMSSWSPPNLSSVGSFIADAGAGLAVSSDEDRDCTLPPDVPWADSSGDADADTLAPLIMLPPPLVMVDERDRVWVRMAGGGSFCRRRVSSLRDGGNRGITPVSGEQKLTYCFTAYS
jgi:hypothetical protein